MRLVILTFLFGHKLGLSLIHIWVTAAGSYEAYTGEFIPAEGIALEDESAYVSTVANLMENRDAYAQSIIATNYYRHVFPAWTGGMKVTDAIGGSN